MLETFIPLDNFGNRDSLFIPLDSFMQKNQPQFMTLSDFQTDLEKKFRFEQAGEEQRLYGERGTPVRPAGLLEQLARGFVRESTLGISKYAIKEKLPQNIGEDVTRAVGSFIGFIGLPIAIGGKVASFAVKGVGKLIAKEGVKKVAQYATRGVVSLGVAEVAADITNISEAPQRALSGATIGAIFGATHGIHIKGSPLLSNIARQFGGRALLGVAGRYDENTLKKENVGNLVFNELLHTFFFSRGITKAQILSGDITPKKWREVDAVQKAIDTVNAKIPQPFMGKSEIARLPNVIRAIASLDNDRLTGKAIDKVESITDIRYNIKKGTLIPYAELDRIPEIQKGDLWFKRNPETGAVTLKYQGAAVEGDRETIGKIGSQVEKEISKIVKFPTMQLEQSATGKKILDWTYDSLVARKDLPFRDLGTFFKLFPTIPVNPMGKPKPRWTDLRDIQQRIKRIEDAPTGQAPEVIHEMTLEMLGEPRTKVQWNKPGFKELHDQEMKYQAAVSYQRTSKEWKNIDAGKGGGSPLIQISKPTFWKSIWDLRKIIQYHQRMTGLPWWTIGKKVILGGQVGEFYTQTHLKPFTEFKHLAKGENKRLEDYFDAREVMWGQYRRKGISEKKFLEDVKPLKDKLTDREKEYVGIIESTMLNIAPDIKLSRFHDWMEAKEKHLLYPEKRMLQIYKKQKDLEPVLEQIYQNYKRQGVGRSKQEVEIIREKWLIEELKKHNFGIFHPGNYLPGVFSGKIRAEDSGVTNDFITAISELGRTHFKIRATEKGELSKRDMEEMILESHFRKEIPNRIESYIRHVANKMFLEKPLKQLFKLTDIYRTHLEQSLPEALGKKGTEAKAYSLLNYIDTWAHRAKGYPVKIGQFGHFAKWTQSLFFRSLVVRPRLPFRNLFQGVLTGVTVPDKRILNPKWWGRRKNQSQRFQEDFLIQIDQVPGFKKHFLFMEETDVLKSHPILGLLFRPAEKVGNIYPLSDRWNRSTVAVRTYKRDTFFVNQYRKGEISEKQLYEKLALFKMDALERRDVLRLLDDGKDYEAKFYHAKWMVDNSQWIYKRQEKSLFEMTGEGEWLTNLFTWTKGITQHTIEAVTRFQEGMERGNKKMVQSSTTQLMGLLFVGQVANYTLQYLTNRHGSSYTDYGIDMYIWEVGGVTVDLIKNGIEATANLLTSIDGTPEERDAARRKFLKFLDTEGIRQLIPFTKTALSIYEAAVGRSYVSPIYNLITKKGLAKVDRTLVERLAHAIWSTDPNKSRATYKWATEQEEIYRQAYLKAKNPVSKAKNHLLYLRYQHLSDLFGRYQPIKVYGYYERRKEDKIMKRLEPDYWLKARAAEKRKWIQKFRKWQHGYPKKD